MDNDAQREWKKWWREVVRKRPWLADCELVHEVIAPVLGSKPDKWDRDHFIPKAPSVAGPVEIYKASDKSKAARMYRAGYRSISEQPSHACKHCKFSYFSETTHVHNDKLVTRMLVGCTLFETKVAKEASCDHFTDRKG